MSTRLNQRSRVLVVDDDAVIRRLTTQALTKAGFEVLEASTADEGIAHVAAKHASLDAVVTDVEMPGMLNGYDLAWRAHSGCPGAPLFVVSSSVEPDQVKLPPGGRFFQKPVDPRILIAELRRAVDLMRRARTCSRSVHQALA